MDRKTIRSPEEAREIHRVAANRWNHAHREEQRERSLSWQKAHPERSRAIYARYRLKKRLAGAPRPCPELCEVCGRKGQRWSAGTLCRDHDHVTGLFRGWLCHKCNLALGNVNDSVDVLRGLAKYLESYRELKLVNRGGVA
jgi:hypothetical protein